MDTVFLVKVLGALFAIMNPFVNLPVFLGLTEGMDTQTQRRNAMRVVVYSAVMCAVAAVAGQRILGFFGVSIDDFRVAGGLVVGMIAFGLLNGTNSSAHHGTPEEQREQAGLPQVAFYPMTFPMLVGPGTITTLVVFLGQAQGTGQHLAFAVALAAVLATLGIVFWFGATLGHYLSATLRVIMGRLMGMILLAIAVGMVATGLKALLPGLG
ncbi:MAG: NAAT family transporter [Rhodobacteraceae bacterium]|nr:NAAT family transporter [Paracoccaceae bacterium]